ncbi:MAG: methyl-accepting chemotaxis protein [Candidatus Thiodiazotropha sp. (ex Epidulcina cf. delphinae)]|nr:methyl-accepting chemotaxis protein [Candidatus Thiodiazotropha sp. (ex Epidulcina cf. delphinae)]
MSIKNKLIALAVSITAAMAAMILLLNFSLNRIDGLRDTSSLVGVIEVDMLTLRRHEKDFLSRRALKYRDAFNERATSLEQHLAELGGAVNELGLDSGTVDRLTLNLKNYAKLFNAQTALQQEIGLDAKSGLYGRLRDSVHEAEGLIKELGDSRLLADMLMLRRNEKDFMLRMNLKYLSQFDNNYETLISTLSTIPATGATRQDIQASMQRYRKEFHAFVEVSQKKGLSSKEGKLGELRGAVHEAEGQIEEMSNYLSGELSAMRTVLKSTMVIIAFALALALVSAVIAIMRSVIRRLNAVDARMRDIAEGEGDLTKTLDSSGNDEIARVGRSFNRFVGKIHDVIKELRAATLRLAAASEQMSGNSSRSLENMQNLSGETGQVATAMTEMTATVQEVARNVEGAAQAARDSDEEAQRGYDVVSGTIHSINNLASEVKQVAEVIEKLAADSQDIGGILDVIRGIADQTNLLALNAAIEAARAGDQGRGFAVVADEVRTLAKRTQESTEEIQRMIEHIQTGADNAVQAMENGRSLAEKSVQEAEAAGSSLESITGAARTISDLNAQIASAVEEQSTVATEIDRSIHNISHAVEETTQNTHEVTAASGEVTQLMSALNHLVEQFRIAEK